MTKSADTAAIADIRKTIREAFGSLSFKESSHSYTLGGNSLRSVSNCVKQYKQPFDTDTVAAAYAKKNKLKVEDVKKQWNDKSKASCDFGTMVHNFAEDRFYNRHGESINGHTDAVLKFWDEIPDTIKPVMAEARVYSEPLKFAGTFDNLFYCTERKGLVITDYKTNEDLHKNFKNQRMLEPFDFLLDTPFHAYELQLSMYQVPLEDIGLKVVNRFIIWLKPDGTYERIKATDYTDHLRYYLTLN